MAFQPTTRPETWVPAGAERGGPPSGTPNGATTVAEGPAARRRPSVTLPPKESLEPERKRTTSARKRLARLPWIAAGMAVPWAWFLIRDLGPAVQLVAFALPLLVAASLLGLVVAAVDGKRVATLFVAASVALFGWTAIMGPRGAQPSPLPTDPLRVAAVTVPDRDADAKGLAAAIARARADVLLVAAPAKRIRDAALQVDGYRGSIVRAPFVLLSRFPVEQLPLAKGLAKELTIRVRVDRPEGSFIVYGANTGGSPLDGTLETPVRPDRLREAILAEQLPVVLMGDLGITDRSTEYRSFVEVMRDAMRAGGRAQSTLASPLWTPLLLRVDHVFTWASWCARGGEGFEVPGTDHVGLSVAVGPCPDRG